MNPRFKIEIFIHDTEGEKALRAVLRDTEHDTAEIHSLATHSYDPDDAEKMAHTVQALANMIALKLIAKLRPY